MDTTTRGAPSDVEAPGHLVKRAIRTKDRDLAESLISSTYEPTAILPGSGSHFGLSLTTARLHTVTFGQLRVEKPSRVFGQGPAQHYFVSVPLEGRVACRGLGADLVTVPGLASIYAPGQVPDTVWSASAAQVCIKIPQNALQAELEVILEGAAARPLVLEPAIDLRDEAAQSWLRLIELISREIATDGGLTRQPVTRVHLEQLLLHGLLLGHRHSYTELLLDGDNRSASHTAVARAAQLLEEDPGAPWTVLSLASKVHLSVRALQEGFRRERGTTPMGHLRAVRLRRVREELVAATSTVTVQEVAERWGFHHLGRFAAHYNREYGERPSETMRRATR